MPPNKSNLSSRRHFGPLRRSSSEASSAKQKPPPEVMTWPKAAPVLIVCIIFDALRLMFEMFWFFGPAMAALFCTVGVNSAVGTTVAGVAGKVVAGACTAGAATVGAFFMPGIEAFGVVMAMAVGLAGWLIVGLILVMFNGRIFKENALWFGGSLLLSEMPVINALPALTLTACKMYSTQIKVEKAAYKKWKEENAARIRQEQERQAIQQSQALQQRRAEQQAEFDNEWQGQMAQQEERRAIDETGQEDVGKNEAISEAVAPTPLQTIHIPPQIARPETKAQPPERSVPPPLPQEYLRSIPPPIPTQSSSVPPPLPGQMHATPPPLPPPLPMANISGMRERPAISSDERSVEQVALRNNAFIVHTLAESGQAQHHNDNSNVSGKATYGDDMDIMLAFEPSVSASSVTPGKKAQLWTGDGFILGGGQISEAGGSDQGTVARGMKRRGNRTSSLEEIDEAVGRNKDWHKAAYEKNGTFGMNELVVNNSEVFGFFQPAEKDGGGRYWAFSTETKKDAEMAKRMRKYGATAFDKNMENYRRRFATAQERGIPLYIMTPDREVYEALRVNDDGTVEVGKQLTPEEVAKGRAGLSAEKRKEIGERILKKNIFRKEAAQKEAEEIIKSLGKEILADERKAT